MTTSEKLRQQVLESVNRRKEDIISFTQDLVKVNTETDPPTGHEKPGQEIIAKRFNEMKLDTDVFEPTEVDGLTEHEGYWPGWDYQDRPNVVGVWKGTGGGKSVILNGHIDVVSAGDLDLWNFDPYGAKIKDGRIYGRGSVDMKGPVAGMTLAVQCLQDSGIQLKGDVILESVVNEELGGYNGSLGCIIRGYEADLAIVTEPTELRICPGQKGGQVYRMKVPGGGAHIARWWNGSSALDIAMSMKEALSEFEQERRRQTANNPLFGNEDLFPIPAVVDDIYSFQAGHPNIMGAPTEAILDFWVDALPGETLETVLQDFEKFMLDKAKEHPYLRDHPPKLERAVMRPFHPTQMQLDHPAIALLQQHVRQVTSKKPLICGFESACEVMMFNKWSNTPGLVFGPGSIELAHRPDEYIEIDELMNFVQILALTLVDWCEVAE